MATIREQIDARFRQARLDRDEPTKQVIGMLKAKALVVLKAGTGREEDDKLWLEVVAAYSKELRKSITAYEGVGERGVEPLQEAKFELEFCDQFLPKKLDEAATEALVRRLAEENKIGAPKQMGRLMGLVMKSHRDEVDGDVVRRCAQRVLAG